MDFRDWLNDDYYTLLGISQMASSEEINKAYKEKAKKCHPDIYPYNSIERFQAEQKFKKILHAKNTLIDNEKRNEYDAERQLYQDCYLSSMSNSYNFQLYKQASYVKDDIKRYNEVTEMTENNNKNLNYKKHVARRYYAMCMRAISYTDYNRAWIYFQAASHLEPSLKIPPALWNVMSNNAYES